MKRIGGGNAVGRRKHLPHEGELGFALLLVFLMAAVIGITLWMQLPRVAIQSQRAKEQLLVERGEEFKRAIQLFLRANLGTRFPADMDDLDRGFNNMRFLRHRYKDPMTGKDDWRLIHVAAGGFIDSLTIKLPTPAGTTAASDLAASSSGDGTQPQPTPQRWQLQRPGATPSTNAASEIGRAHV